MVVSMTHYFRRALLVSALLVSVPMAAGVADPVGAPSVTKSPSTPSVATEATPSLPAMSVEQLVERNATARGGAGAWQKVKTMTLAGKMDAGRKRTDGGVIATNPALTRAESRARSRALVEGKADKAADTVIELPFTMDLERPNKTRLEIPFDGKTAVQVFNGTEGWKLRPFLGRHEVETFKPEELKIAMATQELDGPLLNHAAKGVRVALDGTELVEGRPAYRLKLTLKDGSARRLWLDGQTFLEVKFEGAPRRRDGKMRAVATYYKDYRPDEGLVIAHLLETRVEGEKHADRIVIQRVVLNPTLTADRFAKPE
jgi:hypothetical protein